MTLRSLALGASLLTLAATSSDKGRLRKQGEALFSGARPLVGKIRGHQTNLPPEVVICSHCHARSAPDAGDLPAAPTLERAMLLEPRQRRGAPPSAYDGATFCKLLRTGVDPAYVIIDRIMPVYDLTDAACAGLWQYLTQ